MAHDSDSLHGRHLCIRRYDGSRLYCGRIRLFGILYEEVGDSDGAADFGRAVGSHDGREFASVLVDVKFRLEHLYNKTDIIGTIGGRPADAHLALGSGVVPEPDRTTTRHRSTQGVGEAICEEIIM